MFDRLFNRRGQSERDTADDAQTRRWVVLDTETTGLNIRHDHVISIAAVGIHIEPDLRQAHICLSDTFEAFIRQDRPEVKKDNILIHHIGIDAQEQGSDQIEVLGDFAAWVGHAPLFAYHAEFDRVMLTKAFKGSSLPELSNPWVDVQPLANWATHQIHPLGLDECAMRFGLENIVRHQAASDTFLTAELLLCLLPQIRKVASSFSGVQRLAIEHESQRI